jgi:mannitol-1-/sugar-/sorbitol-6-/2-deoxyglucose-6-phosphatase
MMRRRFAAGLVLARMDRAVIFDMDGLLIDSEPLWRQAELAIFASVGIEITDEMAEVTKALRTDATTAYWYNYRPWSGPTLLEIENAVIDRVGDLMRRDGRAKDGVPEILEHFAARGYRIGLASNSPDSLIAIALDKLGITRYFDTTASSVHEREGKPDPAVYVSAAQRLGVPAAGCIVFEDSVVGVQAGKAARMATVAVPPIEHFDDPGYAIADLKLRSLRDFTAEHETSLVGTEAARAQR